MSWLSDLFSFKPLHECEFKRFTILTKSYTNVFVCTHSDCGSVEPIQYDQLNTYIAKKSLSISYRYESRGLSERCQQSADISYEQMRKDVKDGYVIDERIIYLIAHRDILDGAITDIKSRKFNPIEMFEVRVPKEGALIQLT